MLIRLDRLIRHRKSPAGMEIHFTIIGYTIKRPQETGIVKPEA